MRIYEGSPRQDFEEVFRSIGAFLDSKHMRDVILVEVPDGFIVQGLATVGSSTGAWSDAVGTQVKETFTFLDDDIAKFMEECVGRRGSGTIAAMAPGYERSLRVIGRWMDEQHPKDVFVLEQEGSYVIRVLLAGPAGMHHQLAEFTHDDLEVLIAQAVTLRTQPRPKA